MSKWREAVAKHRVTAVVLALALAAALFWATEAPQKQTGATAEERRIAEVLSAMDGAGKVEVVLYTETSAAVFGESAAAKPSGAVIVAEGANDLNVRLALSRAVRTLLGLPENAVDVFPMKEEP